MYKSIVLLDGSAFAMKNGIQVGLGSVDGIEVDNLSLGGTPGLQNLYEVCRNLEIIKKADLIITASNVHDIAQYNDLTKIKISIRNIEWLYKKLFFLNKKILVFITPTPQKWLNQTCIKIIYNMHKKLSKYYGFNVIDLHKYYLDIDLYDFQTLRDEAHDFDFVMREIGKNVALNIDNFNLIQKIASVNDNPKFEIISDLKLQKMITPYCDLSERKNSLLNEKLFHLSEKNKIIINDSYYKNYNLIGMHFWGMNGGVNFGKQNEYQLNYAHCHFKDISDLELIVNDKFEIAVSNDSNINLISFFLASPEGNYHTEEIDLEALANENIEIPKEYNFNHLIPPIELYKEIIDEYCSIMDPRKLAPLQNQIKEKDNIISTLNYLISFFLASPEGNYHTEEIDLEALANENIEIPKEYNFNHLIPPIELYKEIIDEYCSIMDPRKLAPLQNQIKEKDNIISTLNQEKTMLQNELNSFPIKKQNLEIKNLEQDLKNKELQSCVLKKELGNKFVKNININYIDKNSAKSRIQNHLSYKLGQALITNSKSILGYIRMPFVLSYIKDKHKFEQKAYEEKIKENPNLALPPLEAYPDYKEALKEKECFTYIQKVY
ncbi:hypothetical protein [Campylobacter jejuni]|uniref:hypothetical protein n=3 Tax=Campylobacter jejuni TaxID=197 RepID=UPI0021AE86F8|nr:hypothetical protein [Campylobacter jejuni]